MQDYMDAALRYIVRLIRAARRAYARKWTFLASSALVFVGTFSVLAPLGLTPEAAKTVEAEEAPSAAPTITLEASPLVAPAPTPKAAEEKTAYTPIISSAVETGEGFPIEIEAPSIGLRATVANPSTTDIATLDRLLLSGAVRYPTSAILGEDGNVIIFGHSSYLPVVHNQAFKTFNDIQKFKQGDRITVYSNDTAYVYDVRTVVKADAESAAIPLSTSGRTLTLATCNSFGTKSERFVVTATFVESHLALR